MPADCTVPIPKNFPAGPRSALVEFGVLGPLRVATGAGIAVLPAKQRVLLAVLLTQANRVVPLEKLIEALWDSAPPPTARITAQGHVKRLRQMLGSEARGRVVTRAPGYLITVARGELAYSPNWSDRHGRQRPCVTGRRRQPG